MKKEKKLELILWDKDSGDIKSSTTINDMASMIAWKEESKKAKNLKRINKSLTEKYGEKLMIYQDMLDTVIDDCGYEEMRMLFYLIRICDFENWINQSQKEMAIRLKTKQPAVSRAINQLKQMSYILVEKKNRANSYRLNPLFGWKGGFEQHKNVLSGGQ